MINIGYKVLNKCPVCKDRLKIEKLKCNSCGTVIENQFELSKFDYLDDEQLYFAEVFIKCRGSIKDVEKHLGISYPTVRAKLDDVINSLNSVEGRVKIKGSCTDKPIERKSARANNINDILDKLEKGEITAEQATKLL